MHDNGFGPARLCVIGFCLSLAVLCSSGTTPPRAANGSTHTNLPPEISFNKGAGRGDFLFVTLRSDNGEELLFDVELSENCKKAVTFRPPGQFGIDTAAKTKPELY